MPGSPDPLHAPPDTADMSRRATFMTESAAASATAPGAAVAATTAAIIAMCFSMIHLIMQGEACMLPPRPVRTLTWIKTKTTAAVDLMKTVLSELAATSSAR